MSFLTKEQLDKYVKDLASKTPKTTSLKNAQSKSPPVSKVSQNSPLSSPTTSYPSISRVGPIYGPRSPPPSNRSSLTSTTSPRGSVIGNKFNENSSGSSLNEIKTTTTSPRGSVIDNKFNENNSGSSLNEVKESTEPITQNSISNNNDGSLNEIKTTEFSIHKPTEPQDSISNDSSAKSSPSKSFSTISPSTTSPTIPPSNSNDHEEKKSKYKSIDDIVNDLSYPMETKLSFKSTPSPQSKVNNSVPPPKGADDQTKGSYVLSAAFRSYSAASRTPSVKRPVIQPAPKQEQREIALNKKQRDSTIQELQNRSDTNWNARYDEAQQKFPPLNKLDEEVTTSPFPSQIQNKNNLTGKGSSPQNSKPLTSPTFNNGQTIRPTSSLPLLSCAACEKPISGNVLSAMGKKWHPDHFVCKNCGITLEHVAFFEHDGNPYCHLDFHELFSPKCGYCETPIEGQAINALGKSWHPEHFFCRECGNTFEGGYMVHDGFPYCEKDWMKLFAPKCKGCGLYIKGEFTKASDGLWHRDCFVCTTCKEPFNSSYYYVFDGSPYCDKHYKDILS